MGLSQSQPGSGASSGPTAPPLSSMAAYFHSPPSTLLTHDHPMPACEGGAVEAALAARLPPDIVQRILDLAGVWTACRRTNRRLLVVQAGGAEPHGRRGSDWRTGQEEEVTAEIAAGQGLEDGPGNVWYLVSAAVGCISGSQAGGREREDWEATDGPAVLGAERAAWMAASREARLAATGGGEGGGGEEEEGEGALTAEEVEKERGDKIDGEEGGRGAESRPSPAQESRQRWWLRKVVLETYSRDQGWTVNDDHYGAQLRARGAWATLTSRHVRVVVLVVRAQPAARWARSARLAASRAVQCCWWVRCRPTLN